MEVGSEATRQAYLEALWAATREMARVLKPTGSIWINLGDKYSERTGGRHRSGDGYVGRGEQAGTAPQTRGPLEKSLLGLPWRYAIGCIDQLGLILRRDLIWSKPSGLPESVTDRPRSSHEYWFMFVKQPRYFAALDELREPQATIGERHGRKTGGRNGHPTWLDTPERALDPLGKLPGSVWSIPSEPLRLPPWTDTQHYAAFPTEWPRRLILGFTPHLICLVCGVGRFPVVDRERAPTERQGAVLPAWRMPSIDPSITADMSPDPGSTPGTTPQATILGYACACIPYTDHPGTGDPERSAAQRGTLKLGRSQKPRGNDMERVGPWREYHLDRFTPPPGRPAVVLDPFGGTGTVAHVARALGRHAISIDLSKAYCWLAADATLARQRAGKVLGRVHLERQGTLL